MLGSSVLIDYGGVCPYRVTTATVTYGSKTRQKALYYIHWTASKWLEACFRPLTVHGPVMKRYKQVA